MFSSSLESSMIFTSNPCISQLIVDYLTAKETIALSMTCHDIQSHLKLTVIDISLLSDKENVQLKEQQQPTNEQGETNFNDDEDSNATVPMLLLFQEDLDDSGATTTTTKQDHPKYIQLLMKLCIPVQNPIHAVNISFTLAKFPTCDGPLKEILLVKEREEGEERYLVCTSVLLPQLYNKATITIQTASLEQHCHFRTNTYSIWGILNKKQGADTSSYKKQPTISDVKMKVLSYNEKENNMNHSTSRAAENAVLVVTRPSSRTDTAKLCCIHTKCIKHPIVNLPSFHTSIQAIPIEPFSFLSCFGMVH